MFVFFRFLMQNEGAIQNGLICDIYKAICLEMCMWNFNFAVPGFMILIILLIYYFSRQQLSVRVNKTFLWLLVCDSFVIMLDMLSSSADTSYSSFASWLLYLLNLLFFVAFLVRAFLFFLFLTDILEMNLYARPQRLFKWGLVFFLCELITFASPVFHTVFYIDGTGYHSGPFYNIIYVCFFYYIFCSLFLLYQNRKRVTRAELISAAAYNLILLIGLVVRFLMPTYLVMNTFCLMALIVIYLSFQNPDFYSSDRGPAFNSKAFRAVIQEQSGVGEYKVLCFVIRSYSDQREIYGYKQMDEGITLISSYLVSVCREQEVFYLRNGCFGIVGQGTMDRDALREKIYRRFQEPWRAVGADLFLNISFVQFSERSAADGTDTLINRLLSAFDQAGRKAASAGGLIDLDEIHEVNQEVDIKRALEHALDHDEVEIFLQPLIECSSGTIKAAEVLARIRNEQGAIIPPGAFIPIAEQNGQINRLGAQVFEKACRFIRDGNLERTRMEWLNVNLSPIQCMKKDLSSEFDEILRRYQVDACQIHLEITEASMIDLSILQKQIQKLREDGFEFALDDYGTGYSNLTRVKHYPFINIKLDMEVVWDYFRERDVLLPALIQAFKQLHFSITAEGIETKEMAEVMQNIGCDYLQGFYFSKPLSIPEFIAAYQK